MRPINRKTVLEAYHKLFAAGLVYNVDFHSTVLAILLGAVPEQIERCTIEGHVALRIKTFSWVEQLSEKERVELFWELLMASNDAIEKESVKPIRELIESWRETANITSDKELMKQLKRAEEEYKSGNVVPWGKVKKEVYKV